MCSLRNRPRRTAPALPSGGRGGESRDGTGWDFDVRAGLRRLRLAAGSDHDNTERYGVVVHVQSIGIRSETNRRPVTPLRASDEATCPMSRSLPG